MFAAVLALSLVVPTADAKDKELSEAAKKELKKLEGTWKATKVARNGQEDEPQGGDDVFMTFKGQTLLLNDVELLTVANIDTSTDPKCIDFKALVDRGSIKKDTAFEGIYKLDGDTLVIALNPEGGANRPVKFEAPKDSKVQVMTFKREKK